MKKLIKKTTVTAISIAGILSMLPSALCAPLGSNYEEGKVDNYSAMIIGKYFNSMEDLYNLMMVNKKYRSIIEKYHYNPVAITSRKQLTEFPRLETCYVGNFEKDFISTFPNENIKTLIYTEGSFDAFQFEKVLMDNNIINESKKYTKDWKHDLKILGENSTNGCRVTFTNNNKKIVFLFAPPYSGRNSVGSVREYNELMECYELNEAIVRDWIMGTCHECYTTYMADYAFQNCNDLQIATIFGLNKNIGKGSFEGCSNLIIANLPSSIEIIGENAFKNCKRLREIDIPKSTMFIQKHAFQNCESLKTVKVKGRVESIDEGAFEGCHNLEFINFPRSITSIGESAFKDCENLKRITIPISVKNIGKNAFDGCVSLTRIKFNGKVYKNVGSFMQSFNEYRSNQGK